LLSIISPVIIVCIEDYFNFALQVHFLRESKEMAIHKTINFTPISRVQLKQKLPKNKPLESFVQFLCISKRPIKVSL